PPLPLEAEDLRIALTESLGCGLGGQRLDGRHRSSSPVRDDAGPILKANDMHVIHPRRAASWWVIAGFGAVAPRQAMSFSDRGIQWDRTVAGTMPVRCDRTSPGRSHARLVPCRIPHHKLPSRWPN